MFKKKLIKKVGTILTALAIVAVALPTSTFAAEGDTAVKDALIDTTRTVSLTIHKYQDPETDWDLPENGETVTVPEGAIPLPNVTFKVEKVTIAPDKDPTPENATTPVLVGNYTTGADGTVTIEKYVGNENKALEQGTYLVTELENPAIVTTSKAAPFVITLPLANVAGDSWIYDAHVYPKNTLEKFPEIDKDVTNVGNDHDTTYVGQENTWHILPEITKDIATAVKYEVWDFLDEKLDFITGSINLTYKDATTGETIILAEGSGKDYEVSYDNGTRKLTVTLLEAGKTKLANALEADSSSLPKLDIAFKTVTNDKALSDDSLGKEIKNTAYLDYTNAVGQSPDKIPGDPNDPKDPDKPGITVPEEKIPEVHTGGIRIWKYSNGDNSSKTSLEGATFKIASSEQNAKDKKFLKIKDGKILDVGDEGYADAADLMSTSNDKGVVEFLGLKFGAQGILPTVSDAKSQYWIFEEKAPNGYTPTGKPIEVTVTATSHMDKDANGHYTFGVENKKTPVMPRTGGIGTVVFTVGGLVLIAGGMILLLLSSRKKKVSENR